MECGERVWMHCDHASAFAYPEKKLEFGKVFRNWSQLRFMTTSKGVRDRSKNKRVNDLEIATEKQKGVSKMLVLMEMLKKPSSVPLQRQNSDQWSY
ncbi:hypothetical protein NL676_029464 [Syzygium grande]|nr:hypothetical protein NL676_029464 [Syzygium grande]